MDAVSQSFVESGKDLEAVREAAQALGHQPFIIAKIERSNALNHLDDILAAADGVMIARGDLGVEIPIEQIAGVQKQIMRKANLLGKPVITATQMLESMVENPRPTRAEVSDVANALLDGTDCVMLTGETAAGKYPLEAVQTMVRIAQEAERMQSTLPTYRTHTRPSRSFAEAVAHASVETAVSALGNSEWQVRDTALGLAQRAVQRLRVGCQLSFERNEVAHLADRRLLEDEPALLGEVFALSLELGRGRVGVGAGRDETEPGTEESRKPHSDDANTRSL